MKEDFVSYDISVKLKDKGYPQKSFGKYSMVGACYFNDGRFYEDGCIANVEDCCSAPQIHEVLKWLREERGIFVEISPAYIDITFYVSVYKIKDGRYIRCCILEFKYKSYEQAAIAGIEYVIDKLI